MDVTERFLLDKRKYNLRQSLDDYFHELLHIFQINWLSSPHNETSKFVQFEIKQFYYNSFFFSFQFPCLYREDFQFIVVLEFSYTHTQTHPDITFNELTHLSAYLSRYRYIYVVKSNCFL